MDFCQVCGNFGDLHEHHIVPISLGGKDDESNTILICEECHGKIHDADFLKLPKLIKIGIEKSFINYRFCKKWIDTDDNYTELTKLIIDYQASIDNQHITELMLMGYLPIELLCLAVLDIRPPRGKKGIDLSIYNSVKNYYKNNKNHYNFT